MNDIERKLKDLGERTAEDVRYGEVPRARIVRRARLRRGLVVGVPAIAAVLLAAVVFPRLDLPGRGEGRGRVVDLAAVASATEGAGTARVEMEMIFDRGEDPRTVRGIGVLDFEKGRSRMVMEPTDLTGRVEIVSVGTSMFIRVLDQDGFGQPQWHETELPEGTGVSPALGGDPSDFLSDLKGVSHDVTNLGEETLDGEPVIHYSAEMDAPSALPEGMEFDAEPMEVWVDEEGRLRRLTFGGTTGAGSMHMDMRLWDFGTPVEIEAPDPEDVTEEPVFGPGDSAFSSERADGLPKSTEDATGFLIGPEGPEGPVVVVNMDETGFTIVCVEPSSRDWTRAAIVHERSGRRILTIALRGPNKAPGIGTVCDPGGMPHEDADALLADPSQFSLTLHEKGGGSTTVPLTERLTPATEE